MAIRIDVRRRRFTREEYHRMAAAGILHEDDRLELIDGEIVDDARPEDVLLLVEVADTSQRYDRQVKVPIYRRTGVAEVWIVDLPAEVIEAYRDPTPSGYARVERVGRGGVVSPAAFPDIVLPVDAILVLSSLTP